TPHTSHAAPHPHTLHPETLATARRGTPAGWPTWSPARSPLQTTTEDGLPPSSRFPRARSPGLAAWVSPARHRWAPLAGTCVRTLGTIRRNSPAARSHRPTLGAYAPRRGPSVY